MKRFAMVPMVLTLTAYLPCCADPTDPANGWRGNGTGRWPEAHVPLQWQRIPKGVITDLRARADRPGAKMVEGTAAVGEEVTISIDIEADKAP